jgi:nucleoside-diphosphate-sugar epimerase
VKEAARREKAATSEAMHAADDWVILVTGSSGLIGFALAARLSQTYRVIGFDRPGAPHPPPGVEDIPVDLTSDDSVISGLQKMRDIHGPRVASVIHLAAYFDFSGEPNPLYQQVTVQGTRRLLHGLHALQFQVEQFVFSSTMLVHAPCEPGQAINEEWPLDPRWPYPESKVEAEQVVHQERGKIPSVIARISGVYDDRCHAIPLAQQISRIHQRSVTGKLFAGHIAHGQSYMHLDDLIDAFIRIVDRRAQLPEEVTVLLGEPEPLTYDELQHQFGRLLHNEDWETAQIPKIMAKTGAWMQDAMPLIDDPFIKPWMIDFADDHYALDIRRANKLLGWEPHCSLRETLPNMIAAFKRDPLAWYREHNLEPPKELAA